MRPRGLLIFLAVAAAFGLLAAACGDDGGSDDSSTSTSESTAESTTSAPSDDGADAAVVEASPLTAVLGDSADTNYLAGPDGEELYPAGSVTANWYSAGDTLAVVYTGAPTDMDLCPGASVQSGDPNNFEFVANAPSGDPAGCEGFPTLDPAASARVCGPVIIFTSVIPTDAEGTLYGTLELSTPDLDVISRGATSTVDTTGEALPELDTEATAYSFPTEMVAEGDVTC